VRFKTAVAATMGTEVWPMRKTLQFLKTIARYSAGHRQLHDLHVKPFSLRHRPYNFTSESRSL
jgi:hypothetical protein